MKDGVKESGSVVTEVVALATVSVNERSICDWAPGSLACTRAPPQPPPRRSGNRNNQQLLVGAVVCAKVTNSSNTCSMQMQIQGF